MIMLLGRQGVRRCSFDSYDATRLSQADDRSSRGPAARAVLVWADFRALGTGGLPLVAGARLEPEPGLLGTGPLCSLPDTCRDRFLRRYGTGRALAGGGDLLHQRLHSLL